MKEPRYYGPNFPRINNHLTLEGTLQSELDAVHMSLHNHSHPTDPPLSGPEAQQTTRGQLRSTLFALAGSWPRLYPDAVQPGQNAQGLAWYYWHRGQEIFAFYGR